MWRGWAGRAAFDEQLAHLSVVHDLEFKADAARRALFWPITLVAAMLTPLALHAQLSNWERRVNNFETMVRDAATGNAINVQGNGWFTDSALMMAPLAVMLLWVSRYRWWGWGYFALFAFLQAGTGTRQAIIFAIAASGIAFLLERGRRWLDWRYVLVWLAAAVAFNQLVIDRGSAVRAQRPAARTARRCWCRCCWWCWR